MVRFVPQAALPAGRVACRSARITPASCVSVGGRPARVLAAGPGRLAFEVPPDATGGPQPVTIDGESVGSLVVAMRLATGFDQVDSPAVAPDGALYVTCSGTRADTPNVSVFRVGRDGERAPVARGIRGTTSVTTGPDGRVYVSSRFEGCVYRLADDGLADPVVTGLGAPCGLAFDENGRLHVGDRTGTVFRVEQGRALPFAQLPPSVAAFHLVASPGGGFAVTAPTLASTDVVYRVSAGGEVTPHPPRFGRPQGLAYDADGTLHVVDALAGDAAVYRIPDTGEPERVVTGPGLVGLAFRPDGEVVLATRESLYTLTHF